MSDVPYEQEQHTEASRRVDDTLYDLLQEGVIPDGGVVVSSITVLETMTEDGQSRTFMLTTDKRKTMLFGLLQVGSMHVMGG